MQNYKQMVSAHLEIIVSTIHPNLNVTDKEGSGFDKRVVHQQMF